MQFITDNGHTAKPTQPEKNTRYSNEVQCSNQCSLKLYANKPISTFEG